MADLYDQIQAEIAKYPDRRGAILPALRHAQEHYGWLSPEAIEAVAEALDLSPARCVAVASFYDMFFLQPVGEHVVEVCTNLSCALVGSDQVLRRFEDELGVRAPGTSEDGCITLRRVECLGGCGWGPVVSVDEEYQEHFKPEDVGPLCERLRASRPTESHA
ncbi:MAG: dehydrogenase [Actinomycetota bacterium]|jgi:NADH-quinone oxidoreductase subunit E